VNGVVADLDTEYASEESLLARHDFMLIDRGAYDDTEWEEVGTDHAVVPLVPSILKDDADKTPVMLALKSLSEPQKYGLCDLLHIARESGNEFRFPACLLSAPGVESEIMQSHLKQRLVADSHRGRIFLRFYDPRVFPHLLRVLAPQRLLALFGPILEWTILFEGEWTGFTSPETDVTMQRYWALEKKEADIVLDVIAPTNTVLMRWRMKQGRFFDREEFDELSMKIGRALKVGSSYGFRSRDDLSTFALQTLEYGEGFYHHPAIKKILEIFRGDNQDGASYEGETAMLDKRVWSEIGGCNSHSDV